MCRCSTLALVALTVLLGSQTGEGFGFSPSTTALKRCPPLTGSRDRASTPQLLVCSATTATGPEEKTEPRRSLLRRGESYSSRRQRRVTGRAVRRRAKRLHRIRKIQQARTVELNDVGLESQHDYEASLPATSERLPAAGEDQKAARLAVVTEAATATAESTAAEEALSALVDENKPGSRRHHASNVKGRRIAKAGEGRGLWRSIFGPRSLLEVHSVEELSRLVDVEDWALEDLSVLTPHAVDSVGHPAVLAVLERAARGTTPSAHGDGRRIGLAIEGGGMRGCVAAGMASCLHFLGLADSFDGVYGASAGSLVGAYFVSRQSNGTAVYHDVLPSAGARFIDMAQFPQALGFKLPKVKAARGAEGRKKDDYEVAGADSSNTTVTAENDADTPAPGTLSLEAMATQDSKFARVIGLDYLLEDVVGKTHALDFEAFRTNDRLQPLHVVASGVSSMSSVSLASRRGHFSTLEELTACVRASMLVPGLAGPLRSVRAGERADSAWRDQLPQLGTENIATRAEYKNMRRAVASRATSWALGRWRSRRELLGRRRGNREVEGGAVAAGTSGAPAAGSAAYGNENSELLVDAMVFEPLPYRSAIEDGCTHVVVLCTRPKGSQVLGKKPSIYETRVVKKYFQQHEDPAETFNISDYLQQLRHLRTYAEDALVLDRGSTSGFPQAAPQGGPGAGREAFVVAVAPDASSKEVSQLDMDRRSILQGCRDGFAACYDLFMGEAAAVAGETNGEIDGEDIRSGAEVALEYFPDSVLSTPVDLNAPYFDPGYQISSKSLWPTARGILTRGNGDRTNVGAGGGENGSAAVKEATVASGVPPARVTAASAAAAADSPLVKRARGRLRRLLSRG